MYILICTNEYFSLLGRNIKRRKIPKKKILSWLQINLPQHLLAEYNGETSSQFMGGKVRSKKEHTQQRRNSKSTEKHPQT